MNQFQIEQLVVPEAGQQFMGDDFRSLRQPGVYVFMFEGLPLYIGMASKILGRVGGTHKQGRRAIAECDQVLLYPCVSLKAARQLELLLIAELRPHYNGQNRFDWLKKRLGMATVGHLGLRTRVSRAGTGS